MEYGDLLPWEAERWGLKRGACLTERGFSRPVLSSYIQKTDRCKSWKERSSTRQKATMRKVHWKKKKKRGSGGYLVGVRCWTWLEKRRRQKESKRRRQAGGKLGGKMEPSKLRSIFRKMFICRSVKLTRGVYLPDLPSLSLALSPSLSLSLCCHLLRSLSLSVYSGTAVCTNQTILRIHCKVRCKYASGRGCCWATLYGSVTTAV